VHNLTSKYGRFAFPDPRRWPAEAVQAFDKITGGCRHALMDVFILDYGNIAAMHLEDALTALAVLPVTRERWSTELGYPTFAFDPEWIEDYSRLLAAAGYRVHVMEEQKSQTVNRGPSKRGSVVNIGAAREAIARRRRKWA